MMGNLSFKKLLAIAFMFGAVGISSTAMAWVRNSDHAVQFDTTSIYGSLATARNSNTVQHMGIQDSGWYIYIYAYAVDGGRYTGCLTSDAAIVAQVRSAHPDTNLWVSISDGTCTSVTLQHSSDNDPKNH